MAKPILFRSSLTLGAAEGRTLSGLAVPWDTPTMVRDLIGGQPGPRYLEAFAPQSCDITLRAQTPRPVFVGHEYNYGPADPIGAVTFSRSDAEGGLVYEAPLSKTARADEMLELVNDGAMRSVSVGFTPRAASRRMLPGTGEVTMRTEVALRELSLAPTGFGQYAEAGVSAVRDQLAADVTFDAQQDAVSDAIEKAVFGAAGAPDGCYVWVRDISDSWAVYEVEGGPADEANTKRTLFKVDYTTADTGEVTLSAPVAVAVSYVPTGRSELAEQRRAVQGFLASHPVPRIG